MSSGPVASPSGSAAAESVYPQDDFEGCVSFIFFFFTDLDYAPLRVIEQGL
jgi:hypothetical protein